MSKDAAVPGGGSTAGKTSWVPLDTTVAHQARMYDFLLGGKDNITQVVSGIPYSASRIPV